MAKLFDFKNDWIQRKSVHNNAKLNKNNRSNSFQQKEIIFFLFSASHVKACLPLLNYIDKEKLFSYKLICGTHEPTIYAIEKTKKPYEKMTYT